MPGLSPELDLEAARGCDNPDHAELAQRAALGDVNLGVGPQALHRRLERRQLAQRVEVLGLCLRGTPAGFVMQVVQI